MKSLLVLLALVASCTADSVILNPRFARKEPPLPVMARGARFWDVETKWIAVPLDHFSSQPTPYFGVRYMTNEKYFEKDGSPIFLMLGGEWSINEGWLLGGNMYLNAKKFGGYMVYTEHRYYGYSWPAYNTETENLKYLSSDQALADAIELIKSLKSQPRFAKSKVIVFGASYAANLAAWIRAKYPEYVDGSLASSAPLMAKADFFEYLETVNDALRQYGGGNCINIIKRGIDETKQAINNGKLQSIYESYPVCSYLNTANELDVQTFFTYINYAFTGVVQSGTPYSLEYYCDKLKNYPGSNMQKVGQFVKDIYLGSCIPTRYTDVSYTFQDTSYSNRYIYEGRLWYYQTCTEFGFYTTTNSKKQPFGDTFPLSYYADNLCRDLFGPKFTKENLAAGIERTNKFYGGLKLNATNVFNVHGSIDPWHRLGVKKDVNKKSPTFVIKGTSHCTDLQNPSINDVKDLTKARSKITEAISKWINGKKEK